MTVQVAIVGSGPAALACAWQLISRGLRPVILDAGEQLPAATAAVVQELRGSFGHWRQGAVDAVTHNTTAHGQALPRKLVFGSDYFHGRHRVHSPLINDSFIDPTFALGGYTVAWGGAMLPIRSADMQGWPIPADALNDGFREVLKRLPFSGANDGLSTDFPLFGCQPQPLRLTGQSQDVRVRLARLNRPGVFASGQARVAVRAADCRYCGLCLSGCPFGVIQTFDDAFRRLVALDQIDYRPGVVVTRMRDHQRGVLVSAVSESGEALPDMLMDRVFLAAGAIGSARIALESMQLYESPVTVLDSQKFAVPLLVPAALHESLNATNTLPSLFGEMRLPSTSPNWTHLQISSFSHYALHAMKARLRIGPLPLDFLAKPLTSRLMIGWAGLHSDHSDRFSLKLLRAHQHGRPILKLQAHPTRETHRRTRRAIAEMAASLRSVGVFSLTPGAVVGSPGAGFHFGGSLPMRASPMSPLETDTQGRLSCWRKVHVIDSAVFPSIPATTMVMTILANAWRIASNAEL